MILGVHTEEELMPHGYREDGEVKQEPMNLVNFTSSESKCDKLLSGKNLPNYSDYTKTLDKTCNCQDSGRILWSSFCCF
jgi:hypothetical protein